MHIARVFHNKQAPPMVILEKKPKEIGLWVITDAKKLSELMLRE
jgi:hypothetical protein